jgi:hypothetical protein
MELVHEFTFTAVLKEAVPIGEGPFGNRRIREVLSGERAITTSITSARLRASRPEIRATTG